MCSGLGFGKNDPCICFYVSTFSYFSMLHVSWFWLSTFLRGCSAGRLQDTVPGHTGKSHNAAFLGALPLLPKLLKGSGKAAIKYIKSFKS
jgi:hypothetical protein